MVVCWVARNQRWKVVCTICKQLYQNRFRTPEYFWFDPESLEFVGLRLVSGQYQDIPAQPLGLWSSVLELYLSVLDGQLRFFTVQGDLVPTPQEAALQAEELVAITQRQLEATQAQLQQLQSLLDDSAS
jgi:Putative restriction endonuclease